MHFAIRGRSVALGLGHQTDDADAVHDPEPPGPGAICMIKRRPEWTTYTTYDTQVPP